MPKKQKATVEALRFKQLQPNERGRSRLSELWPIYREAIPASERKSRDALERMLDAPRYSFFVAERGGEVTAFCILYRSENLKLALLEYMATTSAARGTGVGGRLFEYVLRKLKDTPLVIEVDSPAQRSRDHDVRTRRMAFYKRQGAKVVEGFNYILPLKAKGRRAEMFLLVKEQQARQWISRAELRRWVTEIYVHVYGAAPVDPRIQTMFENGTERFALT